MDRILLNGHSGREAGIAWKLKSEASELVINAFMGHRNPTISEVVEKSGGSLEIGNYTEPWSVGEFAVRSAVNLAFISSDAPLVNGVVDAVRAEGVPYIGPDQASARIEGDKVFSRQLIDAIDPSLNPFYKVVTDASQVKSLLRIFESSHMPVVVKPKGLTGGKGVKIMGSHFSTYAEAEAIASAMLGAGHGAVLLEERIDMSRSVEFTAQAFTDGKEVIMAPISVDYPYRYDDDTGSGTGGMGAFTEPGKPSYLTVQEVEKVETVVRDIVREIANQGLNFNGVLYVGFFASPDGLKIVECNARPGDPECINMMMLLDGGLLGGLKNIATKTLAHGDIKFTDEASVVTYLVNKTYATDESARQVAFSVDEEAIEKAGSHVFFASAAKGRREGEYVTVGSSRSLAIGSTATTLVAARANVYKAIKKGVSGPLDYRLEIGDPAYVQALTRRRNQAS